MIQERTREEAASPARPRTEDGATGYAVRDPLGRKIGTLGRVFVGADGEPRHIEVDVGLLRTRPVLIPVEGLTVDDQGRSVTLRCGRGGAEETCVGRR